MGGELESFKQSFMNLSEDNISLTEREILEFIVWYIIRVNGAAYAPKQEVLEKFKAIGRTNINWSRLRKSLSRSSIAYSPADDGLLLKMEAARRLDDLYSGYGRPRTVIANIIIDHPNLLNRPYLAAIMSQINGAYHYEYFDACAVMMRRLLETLLIEVFKENNCLAEIKNGNDMKMLRDIIIAVRGTTSFHKSRNFVQNAEKIKDLGDTAAHDRYYITKKIDIDSHSYAFRKLIDECVVLARI